MFILKGKSCKYHDNYMETDITVSCFPPRCNVITYKYILIISVHSFLFIYSLFFSMHIFVFQLVKRMSMMRWLISFAVGVYVAVIAVIVWLLIKYIAQGKFMALYMSKLIIYDNYLVNR